MTLPKQYNDKPDDALTTPFQDKKKLKDNT